MNNQPHRIESLLSARLFLVPQVAGNYIYFISNLSGRNSLYRMQLGGSVPEPLLPPQIALQNPHLMNGRSFIVFPDIGRILVLIDQDGDENYQPMLIPLEGGYPEPWHREVFEGNQVFAGSEDLANNIVYLVMQSRTEALYASYLANLESGELVKLAESMYGRMPAAHNEEHDHFILLEGYGIGDNVLFESYLGEEEPELLYGQPLEQREQDAQVPPTGLNSVHFVDGEEALLLNSILFEDSFSPGYLPLDNAQAVEPVAVHGLVHEGIGELDEIEDLENGHYLLKYNIDGASWVYEAGYDADSKTLQVEHVLAGRGELANGVLESITYDPQQDRFALSFSTATSPTQLYTIEGPQRQKLIRHTNERLLGIPDELLSHGEDYPFTSHDGLRISARLYLPAAALDYDPPYPLVYYIHGGPQSQERPDFAWFSMPLIQFLTLNGFAVFVPNVRGSTGYGFGYMHHVVKDWGGQDRLDHVHAMEELLPQDERLDTERAGVVGRSYGGYMTLTLAGRHPDLWAAAVDMFGPYDLLTFSDRIPEAWKPFFRITIGDPVEDRDFLIERSPRTYIGNLSAPLLVIQGKNDPRVREIESRELVEALREQGKEVDYLMLPDEGHDILKHENRVRVYNAIVDFFKEYLRASE